MKNIQIILTFCLITLTVPAISGNKPRNESFTNHAVENDTVTDPDGNIYHSVKIGNQIWLRENLNTTRFSNGDKIPTTNPAFRDISGDPDQTYQWSFGGDNTNAKDYGRLYTFNVVMDPRNVCPAGWHVPSLAEWDVMIDFLGKQQDVAGKLKEAGFSHWNEPNTGATNESGFTALPGGSRNEDGSFRNLGEFGSWWTSTPSDRGANYYYMEHDAPHIFRTYIYQSRIYGFSIRCIKD